MAPWTRHLYNLGRWPFSLMRAVANRQTRRWAAPVFALRHKLGIENANNPVMEGVFSPLGTLTLLSNAFAQNQPDWPPHSGPTGFIFYDKLGTGAAGLSDRLKQFLAAGPPPLLFTLGSSAVTHPGTFYTESARAAHLLGVRAVLLTGPQSIPASENIHSEDYAPYSAIMPLVSAVVHQGGIGTVAQTLRAGKPMVVVPWAHDQPDNGYRLQARGVAKVLPRHQYTASNAATVLKQLFSSGAPARAAKIASAINTEDGLKAACDRIETLMSNSVRNRR